MAETYAVEILHQGTSHTISVSANETVLAAAEAAGLMLPSSCNAGVCTTCAAQLLSGTVSQADGMGISPELQAQGFALLCVSYPRSDLKLETEKEDTVYELQFGQFQK
ncbi:MAG: 2Fe-2S iron-sulfur cluster-binding protein [Cyanobacteria bacterium J069]|nr:MAG: ferredoxin [Cyanobacteria bacterium J069]